MKIEKIKVGKLYWFFVCGTFGHIGEPMPTLALARIERAKLQKRRAK